jgi:hypothetical protein
MRKPKRRGHHRNRQAVLTNEPNRNKRAIQSQSALGIAQLQLRDNVEESAAQTAQNQIATNSAQALAPIAAAATDTASQNQLTAKNCLLTALLTVPSYLVQVSLAWLKENFLTWLFRLFTLISVGYLVYDRFYETGALIQSPASDPKNPFLFPFQLRT